MGFSIGSLFNPFSAGSPLSALGGDYGLLSNPTGAWDKFKNGDTNEINMNIAEKNFALQKENLEYQKALQQKIFDREDSSYARTAQDMRNAGLSPLMMSGTNGAGEAIATEAPQYNYQHTDIGGLQVLADVLSTVQQLRMNQENIREKELQNDFLEDSYETNLFQKRYDLFSSFYDNLDKERREEYNRFFGIHSGMSDEQKKMQIYARAFGLGDDIGMSVRGAPLPLIRKHGKYDEYLNNLENYYNGSSNFYVNPDTYAKAFTGKEMLKTGLDYASQFVKFFNIFNKKKSFGKKNEKDDLDWLPF